MSRAARLLRTQLIRPRHYWVVKAVGAALSAVAAYACLGYAWLTGFVFAAVALVLAAGLLWARYVPPRFNRAGTASYAALVSTVAFARARNGSWWGVVFAAIAIGLALDVGDSVCEKLMLRRARRRVREGGCVRCGYLLRGLNSLNCPECGAPLIARPVRSDPPPWA